MPKYNYIYYYSYLFFTIKTIFIIFVSFKTIYLIYNMVQLMKFCFLFFIFISGFAFKLTAQIPEMRKETWYQEKIGSKNSTQNTSSGIANTISETTDLLVEMKNAYDRKDYHQVIVFYNTAIKGSLSHNAEIYRLARNSMRNLLNNSQGQDRASLTDRLYDVYENRLANIGEENYDPLKDTQWNRWQQAKDYIFYADEVLPETEIYTRMETAIRNMQDQPEHYTVAKMMEISFNQNTKGEINNERLYERYKTHIGQLDMAHNWLSGLPNTRNQVITIEKNKETFARLIGPKLSYEKFEAEYAENIRANQKNQTYLNDIFAMMEKFNGRPLYKEVEGYLEQWANYSTYKQKGDRALRNKKYPTAIENYKKAIELADFDERRAEAQGLIGQVYLIQKNYSTAANYYNQAITVTDNNPIYYINLAQCFISGYETCTNADRRIAFIAACWAAQELLKKGLTTCDKREPSYRNIQHYISSIEKRIQENATSYRQALFQTGQQGQTLKLGGFINRSVVLKNL